MCDVLDARLWLAILICLALSGVAGYRKGARDERAQIERQQLKDERAARDIEGELQRMNNRATSAYIASLQAQLEKARALPKITLPADCPVPAGVGRVLNDAQRLPDDAGTRSAARAAGPAVDSACAAELDICKRNYAEVCVPNAQQLTAIQERWNLVRSRINSGARPRSKEDNASQQ